MKTVNSQEFAAEVLHASHSRPVAVMFTAPWCGPCKTMKPLVESVAASLHHDLLCVDAGADRDLAITWGVRAVPTLMVFENGAPVRRGSVSTEKQIRTILGDA